MGRIENEIRDLIVNRYGSVKKFAEIINIPPTTVYNALDRGIENTRTETSRKILSAISTDRVVYDIIDLGEIESPIKSDPIKDELVRIYESLTETGKEALIAAARGISCSFSVEK